MIKTLFLLAIASIVSLLCFTIVNSNNQMERILFDKRLPTKGTMEYIYDLLNEDNLNNDEEQNIFIRSVSTKPYPDRRSSFHAMRGKRQVAYECSLTPLDDYVNKADPTFSWKRLKTYPRGTYTVHVLSMTSQKWMDDSFSSNSIWSHHMVITVPQVIRRSKTAFLLVDGGDNDNPVPTGSSISSLAITTSSITAVVRQIPNQPIRFWSDELNRNRTEDAIIAWTWKKYLDMNGADPTVLLQLPMTKAVVRAMDTIQQFLQQEHIVVPEKFILSGASKRGWATWLTTAVDTNRVSAAIPVVMDSLNLRTHMMSHYRSLRGWSFALRDYYENNITRYMDSPKILEITAITDPYAYLDRYANVKIFQGQATGDQFFLLDSEDHFWDDLQIATGQSYLRRVPNTDHSIKGFDESLTSFYLSVSDKIPLPSLKWTRTINQTHGVIRAVIDFGNGKPKPTLVTAYQARTNDNIRRDFRAHKLDLNNGNIVENSITWANIAVQFEGQQGSSTAYSITLPIPSDGYWIGSFIQAQFSGREGTTLTLTTETLILPNTYPINECHDQECHGQLV